MDSWQIRRAILHLVDEKGALYMRRKLLSAGASPTMVYCILAGTYKNNFNMRSREILEKVIMACG